MPFALGVAAAPQTERSREAGGFALRTQSCVGTAASDDHPPFAIREGRLQLVPELQYRSAAGS